MLLRPLSAAALAAVLLLAPAAAAPAASAAAPTATPTQAPVSWSVRPGDADGADGRSWVEWEADPGEERTEHLVVSNHGDESVEFRLTAADGYFTDTGRFTMLPSDRESTDAGTWITLPDSITVAPGATEVVPFAVAVPDDAAPGDHPAGVAASILSPGEGTVGVESRVGFRVMTRVSGELVAALTAGASAGYTGSINPFEPGAVDVAYEITNTGNTRLSTHPTVTVAGPFGLAAQEVRAAEIVEIAPGETRSGSVRIDAAWPLVRYDATVTAAPRPVSDELALGDAPAATAHADAVALPWPQLVVLAVAAALVLWWVRARARGRARTESRIAAARAEGRAEADAAATDAAPVTASPMDAAASAPDGETSVTRRARRTATPVLGAVLLAAIASGALVDAAPAAAAETRPISGVLAPAPASAEVGVDVDITPLPTPAPTSTAAPTPAPTGAPADSALPPTGGELDAGVLGIAGALLGAAALVLLTRRAARRR